MPKKNLTSPYPHFIDNNPTGEDLFDGKAHQKIADNLSEIISNNFSENKLIGLDGSWGSGKSNVVRIIEKSLEPSHHLFLYDAWGHQEDLKRRSFLEELIENLCNNSLLDQPKWSLKLKELLAKKRETVTKTVPRLSNGIILTLLVAIFTPISKVVSEGFEQIWLKIIVSGFPIFLGLTIWIIASILRKRFLGIVDIFYLYKEKELNSETHVSISEKEPSVREFQHWLKELSSNLKSKKLIIVFDNMDRLPPAKVMELWSSIHTFFSEDTYDNIWVIVPFDRKHICDAFDNDSAKANHFINKTFSVIHRVTPPVLTDWKSFFWIKYSEAFGQSENEEYHTLRNIFDLLQPEITPRNIIAFINELVSLRLITEEDIKSRYLAIFILTKNSILKEPIDSVLNLNFLGNASELFKDDPMLADAISALIYGVPIKSASQITLSREVELALRENNSPRINEISKNIHFSDILEQVIVNQELSIENTIRCLGSMELSEKDDSFLKVMESIWNNLSRKRRRVELESLRFHDYDKILLKNCSKDERLTNLKYLLKEFREFKDFSGKNYFNTLNDVKLFCETEETQIDLNSLLVNIELDAQNFIDFIKASDGQYEYFKISTSESELNHYLIESLQETFEEAKASTLVNDHYDLTQLLKAIEELIEEDSIDETNVGDIYYVYKKISEEQPIKALSDIKIDSILSVIDEDTEAYYDLVAMRLARTDQFIDQGGLSQSIVNSNDEELAEEIAKRIEFFANYGDLLEEAKSWNSSILKQVLKKITLKSYGISRMNILTVLGSFEEIAKSIGVDCEDFIARLNRWNQSAKKSISDTNISEVDAEFFKYAIEVKNDLTKHLLDSMVKYFNSLSVESWDESLRDEDSYISRCLNWILAGSVMKKLPNNLVTVYKNILTEYAKGEFAFGSKTFWNRIYEKVNKNTIKVTIKNIRDIFIAETTITPASFKYFLPIFMDYGDLNQRSSDVVRKILTPVCSDEASLEIIISNQDFIVPLIENAGDDSYDLKDIIRQKVENSSDNGQLAEFAERIGLELSKE